MFHTSEFLRSAGEFPAECREETVRIRKSALPLDFRNALIRVFKLFRGISKPQFIQKLFDGVSGLFPETGMQIFLRNTEMFCNRFDADLFAVFFPQDLFRFRDHFL